MRCARRGFGAITAIVMIGLVGVTLATLAAAFSAQAKRTRNEAIDAQVRQMVIAGSVGVTELPEELRDGGEIVVTTNGDQPEVRVKWRGKNVSD
jgi:type II secretory pathway component PulK